MSTVNEFEFKDLKQLNELLKNKDKTTRNIRCQSAKSSGTLGCEKNAKQTGLHSHVVEKRKTQRGGNPTPMPWQYFNNENPLNVNNYGQLSAQNIGYDYNAMGGGFFDNFWGSNKSTQTTVDNTMKNVDESMKNAAGTMKNAFGTMKNAAGSMKNEVENMGNDDEIFTKTMKNTAGNMKNTAGSMKNEVKNIGNDDEIFSKTNLETAISDVTGKPRSEIRKTINNMYGSGRKQFGKKELNKIVEAHTNKKNTSNNYENEIHTRENVIDAVSQATGSTKTNIGKMIAGAYGSKKMFSDEDITNAVKTHFKEKENGTMEINKQLYNVDQSLTEISQKTGIAPVLISMPKNKKLYTEKEIDEIVQDLIDLQAAEIYKDGSIKNNKPKNKQSGGTTSMPLDWYNTFTLELPQLMTGGFSKDNLFIQKFRDSKKPLTNLGNGVLVITEENIIKLFDYLYALYPQLKKRNDTKNIFEKADEDDAYIWSEMYMSSLDEIIPEMINSTINYYDTIHSDKKNRQYIRKIFGIKN